MIEITNACTVTFMKARNYLALRCRENVSVRKKKEKMVKIYIFKALEANQLCQGTTKLFMDDLLLNGLHEKVMICYLK